VTGVGTRGIALLAAAALAAAGLTACGGSDSGAGESSTASESTGTAGESPNSGQAGQRDGAQDSGRSEPGEVSTPLKVSGGGSGQFRSKGGDNSVQEYGEESSESELEEAAEALHGFYVARAEEDWPTACTYLAASVVGQLERLASQSSQLKGKGCAGFLHAFTRPLPAAVRRKSTIVDAGSLRTEGERSFLIYYGEERLVYAMPMTQEDGAWKVSLLAATPLG
jgi:hypothetical protein